MSNISKVGNFEQAYLLKLNDKNILIDGVCSKHSDDYIKCLDGMIPGEKVDIVIFNSCLPDNVGAFERLKERYPEIVVYATTAGIRCLRDIYDFDFKYEICKNNQEILGGEIVFYITPNIPTPDTMMTYVQSEKALFIYKLLSDKSKQINRAEAFKRAESIGADKYYCHISGELNKIGDFEYPEKSNSVLVAYSSKFGYTKKMAEVVAEKLKSNGIEAVLQSLDDVQRAITLLNSSRGLALGVDTFNRNITEDVWNFLSRINVIENSGMPYFVFGSYGWSGEGCDIADTILNHLRLKRIQKPVSVMFNPFSEDIENLKKSAFEFSKAFK